jgi:hypothetical protein
MWGIDDAVAKAVIAILAVLLFGNIGLGILVYWISTFNYNIGVGLLLLGWLGYIAFLFNDEWRDFCSWNLIFYTSGILIGYGIF